LPRKKIEPTASSSILMTSSSEHSSFNASDDYSSDKKKDSNSLEYQSLQSTAVSIFSSQVEIDNSFS
jgi:hypothetical protein